MMTSKGDAAEAFVWMWLPGVGGDSGSFGSNGFLKEF